jgi:hypothetical protein
MSGARNAIQFSARNFASLYTAESSSRHQIFSKKYQVSDAPFMGAALRLLPPPPLWTEHPISPRHTALSNMISGARMLLGFCLTGFEAVMSWLFFPLFYRKGGGRRRE